MKKVGMSISLSIKTVVRIEEYIEEHGGTFSGFLDIAAASYLDHNQTVSHVSIQDSELIGQPVEDTLKTNEDTTPKPKNDFNFDDVSFGDK